MQNFSKPTEEKPVHANAIEYLIDLNRDHSRRFCDAGNASERALHRSNHPTEIAVAKCSDGRLNLPVITKTAMGIIQPYRNIGANFDLGWPYFADEVRDWKRYAVDKGRRCLFLTAYHFAKGDPARGCAGHHHDTEKAREAAQKLKIQFDEDFGKTVLHAALIGIETDRDGLVLHGDSGEVINVWEIEDKSMPGLIAVLRRLYPQMHSEIVRDFAHLLCGNIQHMAEVANRPIADVVHREWIIGVGRGFDWLHKPNSAIIVGPFDPWDMEKSIATAARVVMGNIEGGRLEPSQDIVLLASKPYRRIGTEQNTAERAARLFSERALAIITRETPALLPRLKRLTVSVDVATRRFNVLHRS